jgi:hypothetical protein
VTPRRSTRIRPSTVMRSRRGVGAVGAEALERLLADTSAGLTMNAIAKQAGAGYPHTLTLLHELEAARAAPPAGSAPLNGDGSRSPTRSGSRRPPQGPSRRRGTASLVASPATKTVGGREGAPKSCLHEPFAPVHASSSPIRMSAWPLSDRLLSRSLGCRDH